MTGVEEVQTPEVTQPTVITLDNNNSVQILFNFIEMANKAGAYVLQEADILKRCKDVLLNGANDPELQNVQSRQLLLQAIIKGQAKGAYTLDDAALLYKVCQFVQANIEASNTNISDNERRGVEKDDDLSSLSDPVPLKPRVV